MISKEFMKKAAERGPARTLHGLARTLHGLARTLHGLRTDYISVEINGFVELLSNLFVFSFFQFFL